MLRIRVLVGALGVATLGLLLMAPPVGAQVYQPGPTTTTVAPTTTVGPTTTIANTTTTAAGPATTVAGNTPTTATNGAGTQNGGTHVRGETFTLTLCGFQPGSAVSLSVNGQPGPTKTADSSGCVTVTVTVVDNSHVRVEGLTFNSVCGSNSIVGTGPGASTGTFSQTALFTINCPASPTTHGGLAFSGADVAKLIGVAVALIVVGGLPLIAYRRRNGSRA